MEENNRKGPGVFYAVVGVATLVVAIIGATFAYFSASASVNGNENIAGGTQDISNALTADVTAVYTGADAAAGTGLVPTDITDAKANVDAAVAKKCVSTTGYTGCHLYQIHVKSTTTDGMQADTDYYYYLMVYVANTDLSQNEGTNSVLAKYKGTISFVAGSGGKVTASFMSA